MDAAFGHSRFKKAHNIFISVWDQNERALGFYLKYGFEKVGECDVTVEGYDLVLMRPARNG